MTQPGFDFAPVPATPVQRRHTAADRALAKVTRERGRVWLEQASHAIALYAAQHADGWLMEEARAWACDPEGCAVAAPANPKAWGGVVHRLVARKVIQATGETRRSAANACPKPTWKRGRS